MNRRIQMKHGDFTQLAKFYVDRPGYSQQLLNTIKNTVGITTGVPIESIKAADIGAGTGKLTEVLRNIGVTGYAVEPNNAMRNEGMKLFSEDDSFQWKEGAAEKTNLQDNCVDWVLMGSSFHWADAPQAMAEFHRILKPGGYFTAIWNPRNIEASELHMEIERIIYDEIPQMKRVSSGKNLTMSEMKQKMFCTNQFKDIIFMEAPHEEIMTIDRYMNIWKSVNDIRVQAGEEGFNRILNKIELKLEGMNEISVPYLSRAWTVRAI